mmetsp:Transcript_8058/g.15227  ORF Transcript_8058/g.15227 Transcript_8058/m.15227 type:complete len:678 (+) Transcript_8058:138-2171(+)
MNNDKESKSQPSHGLLRNQITTRPRYDNEGNLRVEIVPIEHELSFDKGLFMFIRAVQVLRSSHEGIMVVGLAGPSGAGKTVFSSKVRAFLPGTAHIQMDMYNDGTKVVDENFDDPRLTDYDTLLENISGLRRGEAVQTPVYDFRQSKRVGFVTVEPPASRVVVVEGIYALSSKLRDLLDLRVSIKGGVHFDLVKRVLRDIDRSGQQPEAILQQISSTVYPMYKIHIEPDLLTAHLKVVNHFNPFSGLQNATYTLKSDKEVPEDELKAKSIAFFGEAEWAECKQSTYQTTDIFLLPPGEDQETCKNWIRMRNRFGTYSLVFEEYISEGPLLISPSMSFEVDIGTLNGLMKLGYQLGAVITRCSKFFEYKSACIKYDEVDVLKRTFIQIESKDRETCERIGRALNLENSYIPMSYIELLQLERLTMELRVDAKTLMASVPQAMKPPLRQGIVSPRSLSDVPKPPSGRLMKKTSFPLDESAAIEAVKRPMSPSPARRRRSLPPMLNDNPGYEKSCLQPQNAQQNAVNVGMERLRLSMGISHDRFDESHETRDSMDSKLDQGSKPSLTPLSTSNSEEALWMDAYGATMIPQSPRYSPRNNYPCADGISLVKMDLEKLTTSSRNLESQIRLLTFWVTQNREPHPAATRTSRQGSATGALTFVWIASAVSAFSVCAMIGSLKR